MKRLVVFLGVSLFLILAIIAINQFLLVRKAHSTFENYYAFRGCVQLLKKTTTYALCKLPSGATIKLVSMNGKWYLDKDLPVCYFTFCL